MDPSQQGTRDNWYATHVATHGSLVPSNDNLTTLMFFVASDLDEAQRERPYKFSFSSQHDCSCLHPLMQYKQSLWELFCSSKSSMENPSLDVSGHGGSASITFIVRKLG